MKRKKPMPVLFMFDNRLEIDKFLKNCLNKLSISSYE